MSNEPTTDIQIIQETPDMSMAIAQQPTRRILGNLVRRTIFDLSFNEMKLLEHMAEMYEASSFNHNGKQTRGDFFLMMMKGLELGIAPMAAIDTINIIQGKPTLDAKGMLALVNSSGLLEEIDIDSTKERCIVTLKRKGRDEQIISFTMQEARTFMTTAWVNGNKTQIPLAEKDNWKSMPEIMLKWRAITKAMREVFPDVLAGLYTQEELAPDNTIVNPDGSMLLTDDMLTFGKPYSLNDDKDAINKIVTWAGKFGFTSADEILNFLDKTDWTFIKATDEKKAGADACTLINNTHFGKFIKPIIDWAANSGYGNNEAELLSLVGENNWAFAKSDYDTAVTRIQDAHNALAKELESKSESSSKKDEAPPTTPDVPTWKREDTEIFEAHIRKQFDKGIEELAELPEETFSLDFPVNYANSGEAINKINKVAEDNEWDIVVDSFKVEKHGKGGKLIFFTPVGNIIQYSRKKFAEMVGEQFQQENELDIPELKPGNYTVSHLKISWSQQKSGKTVTSAVVFDPYANIHI